MEKIYKRDLCGAVNMLNKDEFGDCKNELRVIKNNQGYIVVTQYKSEYKNLGGGVQTIYGDVYGTAKEAYHKLWEAFNAGDIKKIKIEEEEEKENPYPNEYDTYARDCEDNAPYEFDN